MAFVDAGFSNHPDIADRILVHVDASTAEIIEQPRVMTTGPASWHGQMTSVVAAGNGSQSGGVYRGLASESELVLIKVSTPELRVKEIDILRGLNWIVGHHKRFNIRVVNVSVGGDYVSDDPAHPLHRTIQDLVAMGLIVTIAAGNRAVSTLVPPASSPEAITVGGYSDDNCNDRRRWLAYGSSYGKAYDGSTKPDLIAPASWIPSPILPETVVEREAVWLGPLLRDPTGIALQHLLDEGREAVDLDFDAEPDEVLQLIESRIHEHKLVNTGYQHVDGTSVAAPITASVIAQMLEANPRLTPEQVKVILTKTAQPIGRIPREQQGAGALNAWAAVDTAARYAES